MIQLFKNKSLKKTRETEQGADNKNAKKQRGRSMVEMLGVLAIIGVLSIGGIQGYTMAMRKYRANEILNMANKYAAVLYASCQTAMEKDPEHYYKSLRKWDHYGTYILGWNCPDIYFGNAGLGALPTGAKEFWRGFIGTVIDPNDYEAGDFSVETPGAEYNPALPVGTDFVMVGISFDSVELCETAFSTVGGMSSFSSDITLECSSRSLMYPAFVEN